MSKLPSWFLSFFDGPIEAGRKRTLSDSEDRAGLPFFL
jgi:hypothetical protein